jgi:uncharacterized membrane protein YhaH (DUF805 family)
MNIKEIIIASYFRAFKFSGFASRKEYAIFLSFNLTSYLLALFLPKNLVFLDASIKIFLAYFFSAIALSTIIPLLALGARRLHDIGRSGWWQLLLMIPFINLCLVLVMLFVPSKINDAV